jgi:oligopeptide transport system permease protein
LARYTLLRLLGAIPTLFLVIVLAFLLVHAAPGGPFSDARALPPEIEARIASHYRLDEPLPRQFVRYVGNLIRGDLGPSYVYRDIDVNDLIGRSFPVSALLGTLAILLALAVGIPAGVFAALRHNQPLDRIVTGFALTGISIPVFVVAPALILLFAIYLGWLPASFGGSGGPGRYVLPVVALALPQIAYIARLTRGSLVDVLERPFIRTARAQGLGTMTIVTQHALKPALLPVVSYLGPAIAGVLTGSVVIEEIFGINGIGRWFVTGAENRDYTLVLGIVVVYASLIILLNLIADLIYAFIDPRVRYR